MGVFLGCGRFMERVGCKYRRISRIEEKPRREKRSQKERQLITDINKKRTIKY